MSDKVRVREAGSELRNEKGVSEGYRVVTGERVTK